MQPSSVLIDNSTYFSSRVAIAEGLIDQAETLYNLANFLECLVLNDTVRLAPTINWSPGADDAVLFGPGGPCQPLHFSDFSEKRLSEIYRMALEAAVMDLTCLSSTGLAGVIPYVTADASVTRAILLDWHALASDRPEDLTPIYSGKVFATDRASKTFLTMLPAAVDEGAGQELQFAHYLFRTCVAIELSAEIPYHPHSFRVDFVCEKLRRARQRFADLSTLLLRFSEDFRKGILSQSAPYTVQRSNVPLILATVLSGAARPDALLPLTMELRDSRPVRRYREWTTKLTKAIETGTLEEQIEARQELAEGKRTLETELTRLYGAHHPLKTALSRISTVLDEMEIAENPEVQARIGAKVVKGVVDYFDQYRHRRKIAILLTPVGKETARNLNDHLCRVFGKGLSSDALADFELLRAADRERMLRLDDQSMMNE
jgi:hypothetical protein